MQHEPQRHLLGIPEMDAQHAHLYSLLDAIENAGEVSDREATGKLLKQIEGYLLFHFASEEHFIRMYGAPNFATHQTDHEQAGNRFVQYMDDFENGSLNPARLKVSFTGWLMEHSRSIDEEYAGFVRAIRSAE